MELLVLIFVMFSIVGLTFDIIGVVLLFYWGPPSKHSDGPPIVFTTQESRATTSLTNKKVRVFSCLGMSFLFIGFVLQLVGSVKAYCDSNNSSQNYKSQGQESHSSIEASSTVDRLVPE